VKIYTQISTRTVLLENIFEKIVVFFCDANIRGDITRMSRMIINYLKIEQQSFYWHLSD